MSKKPLNCRMVDFGNILSMIWKLDGPLEEPRETECGNVEIECPKEEIPQFTKLCIKYFSKELHPMRNSRKKDRLNIRMQELEEREERESDYLIMLTNLS